MILSLWNHNFCQKNLFTSFIKSTFKLVLIPPCLYTAGLKFQEWRKCFLNDNLRRSFTSFVPCHHGTAHDLFVDFALGMFLLFWIQVSILMLALEWEMAEHGLNLKPENSIKIAFSNT